MTAQVRAQQRRQRTPRSPEHQRAPGTGRNRPTRRDRQRGEERPWSGRAGPAGRGRASSPPGRRSRATTVAGVLVVLRFAVGRATDAGRFCRDGPRRRWQALAAAARVPASGTARPGLRRAGALVPGHRVGIGRGVPAGARLVRGEAARAPRCWPGRWPSRPRSSAGRRGRPPWRVRCAGDRRRATGRRYHRGHDAIRRPARTARPAPPPVAPPDDAVGAPPPPPGPGRTAAVRRPAHRRGAPAAALARDRAGAGGRAAALRRRAWSGWARSLVLRQPDDRGRGDAAVTNYLTAVRDRDYPKAYELLCAATRQSITEDASSPSLSSRRAAGIHRSPSASRDLGQRRSMVPATICYADRTDDHRRAT